MTLAIFDLDNTLLSGDSDYLWGQFLCDIGVVDRTAYEQANAEFYRLYREGRLDIMAYQRFSLQPLRDNAPDDLLRWRERFLQEKIDPLIHAPALELVQRHRQAGDTLMVITATNAFITAPIVARFGIRHLIATEPEMRDGRYTGEVAGLPSFHEGKVQRLQQWLESHHASLEGSSFYSDSHNDLPLLERVSHPVAVDPDAQLEQIAIRRDWPIISLRPSAATAGEAG